MSKAKIITNELTENIKTQKLLFRILVSSIVLLFIVYIYLIGSITFNVVARKSLEVTVSNLSEQVDKLDLAYLDKINKIDKEYASSLGFVDAKNSIFVSRNNINHVAIR